MGLLIWLGVAAMASAGGCGKRPEAIRDLSIVERKVGVRFPPVARLRRGVYYGGLSQ